MFDTKKKEVLLMPKLGSFELYTEVPEGHPLVGAVSNFGWRDKRYPKGRGPFVSLWACMEDFKLTVANKPVIDQMIEKKPFSVITNVFEKNSVVRLDFVNKKRL